MTGNELQTLRERVEIETRIEQCRNTAAENIVEIGRLLCRAKDGGIVPHGEWTAWVQEHAGMNERSAQRAMRIARELPEGSPLAALGVAKISSLLALPEGEREAAAREMDAASLSSREVEERVRVIKQERDEALRLVGEQKRRMMDMESEKDSAVVDAIARTRKDVRLESQAEIDRLNGIIKSDSIGKRQSNKLLDQAQERERQLRSEMETLRNRINVLNAQQTENEREIDRLSEQLDEANTAILRGGMDGGADRPSTTARVLSAIGSLMASAGNAPGELARTGGIDAETVQLLIGQAQLVGQWAMQVIAACGGDLHA